MTDTVVDADLGEGANDPVVNLGSRLKAARMTSGMSLREVARQLGVSPSFISQMENGKSQPSVATLYSIAQLLGVSVDALFAPERTDPPTPVPVLAVDPVHGRDQQRRLRVAGRRMAERRVRQQVHAWCRRPIDPDS